MSPAPFNIFSQKRSPDKALAALREFIPHAVVAYHPDGVWSQVTGKWKQGWLQRPLGMLVTHNPDYYASPEWHVQLAGMQGYFGGFEGAGERPDVLEYLTGLSFAISFILDSEIGQKDPRVPLVFEMARRLEGIVFLPGRLFNADAKVLLAADGECDSDAELPPSYASHSKSPQAEQSSQEAAEALRSEPPNVERVANRLLLMEALVRRGLLEREADDAMMEIQREKSVEGLMETPSWSEAEPREAAAMHCKVGHLSEEDAWRLPWLSEGAAVLAWALGLAELPDYDEQVDPGKLFAAIEGLDLGTGSIVVRPLDQLEKLASQMLAIHWRVRQFHLDHKSIDFPAFAANAWCGPMDLTLARLKDGDLEINGRPLSQCPDPEWRCVSGIMEERRKAVHWLLGQEPVYSQNDTST